MNQLRQQKIETITCSKHHQPIILVAIDGSLSIEDRLLCGECLKVLRIVTKISPISDIQVQLRQMNEQIGQQRSKDLKILIEFQQNMKNILSNVVRSFEEIMRVTYMWIKEIEVKEESTQYEQLIKGLDQLINPIQYQEKIRDVSYSMFYKISTIMKRLTRQMDVKSSYDQLNNLDLIKQSANRNTKATNINQQSTGQGTQQNIRKNI